MSDDKGQDATQAKPRAAGTCLDCGHARWEMTKHSPPRINPKHTGRCECPRSCRTITMPAAFMSKEEVERALSATRSGGLSSRAPYADCPTWAPKKCGKS